MRKYILAPVLIFGGMTILSAPTTTSAHGKSRRKGHGHPFAEREPDARVCVPELVNKKRWIYDYVCVPYCVYKCKRCQECAHSGESCDCGQCKKCLHTRCPDCRTRTKKVLVKRQIDDGYEWKCTLKKPEWHCLSGDCSHVAPPAETVKMPTVAATPSESTPNESPATAATNGIPAEPQAVFPEETESSRFFPTLRRLFQR